MSSALRFYLPQLVQAGGRRLKQIEHIPQFSGRSRRTFRRGRSIQPLPRFSIFLAMPVQFGEQVAER